MAKQSSNATPYNYEFRRMLKKRYHLKTMDEANALANEIYKREMMKKTQDAIEKQKLAKTETATIDMSTNISTPISPKKNGKSSIFGSAEIVDIQLDKAVDVQLDKAVDIQLGEAANITKEDVAAVLTDSLKADG